MYFWLLLPANLFFWILYFTTHKEEWRFSLLKALTLQGFQIVVLTEFLSLFQSFYLPFLTVSWFGLTLVPVILLWPKRKRVRSQLLQLLKAIPSRWSLESILLSLGSVFILGLTLFLAWYVKPNNWDSLTYHLPRVEHWIQNRTINFYPAHIDRQLYTYPFAEIVLAQVRILSGGEQFFNLLQWVAFVGSALAASILVKLLKGTVRAQSVAFFFVLTTPITVLQSTTTQNDLVQALWLSIASCFFLSYKYQPTRKALAWFSLSLALAFLTKPTAYFFALPLLIWLLLFIWKTQKNYVFSRLLLMACIVGGLIFSHHYRNLSVYGSPFGKPGVAYTLAITTPTYLISNALKNTALNLVTSSQLINRSIETTVIFIHTHLLKLSINDPATSWLNESFELHYTYSEDSAGNGIHFVSILLATSVILVSQNQSKDRKTFAVMVGLGFLMTLTILRWQPWATRFHVPFYVLGAPIVGLVVGRFTRWWLLSYWTLLWVTVLPFMFLNHLKPLWGPTSIFINSSEEIRFSSKPAFLSDYMNSTHFIFEKKFQSVGIYHNNDEWEYPVWRMLKDLTQDSIYIGNYFVEDESVALQPIPPPYEAVICLHCQLVKDRTIFGLFSRHHQFGSITVYYR